MLLTVFQVNSSCQDKALADLPDGVCVSEMCTQQVQVQDPSWAGVKYVLLHYITSALSEKKKKKKICILLELDRTHISCIYFKFHAHIESGLAFILAFY